MKFHWKFLFPLELIQGNWINTVFSPRDSTLSSQNLQNLYHDSEDVPLLLFSVGVFARIHHSHSLNREHSTVQRLESKNILESMRLRVLPDDHGPCGSDVLLCPWLGVSHWAHGLAVAASQLISGLKLDHRHHVTQTDAPVRVKVWFMMINNAAKKWNQRGFDKLKQGGAWCCLTAVVNMNK